MPATRRIVHAAHDMDDLAAQRFARAFARISHVDLHQGQCVVRALSRRLALAAHDGVSDETDVEPLLDDGGEHRVHDEGPVLVDQCEDRQRSGRGFHNIEKDRGAALVVLAQCLSGDARRLREGCRIVCGEVVGRLVPEQGIAKARGQPVQLFPCSIHQCRPFGRTACRVRHARPPIRALVVTSWRRQRWAITWVRPNKVHRVP